MILPQIFYIVLIVLVYILSLRLYRRTSFPLLQPILVSAAVIILFLKTLSIEYTVFRQNSWLIDFLLGPSAVALGYQLYEQLEHIKRNALSILTAVAVGSLVGILSVYAVAKLMGADNTIIATLQPKSVTTPIAIEIARRSGGVTSLTAVVVISVGILGALIGPFIMKRLGIEDRIARGLALGSAAHGVGTAKAIELGAIEGAFSGLAIGLMGVATSLWVPVVEIFTR